MTVVSSPLSWSKSQAGTLRECKRKYYFHRATPPSDDSRSQLWNDILRLKQLKNRFLWAGSVVHETIGGLLKDLRQGQPLASTSQIIHSTQERMREEFKSSLKDPLSSSRFFEHEYSQKITDQ